MNGPKPGRDGAAGRPFFGVLPSLQHETSDFPRDVLTRSRERLVLAEFWAPWCEPCARLRQALERVAARQPGRFDRVSVNIEMQPAVASAQGVEGLPLVKAYHRGRAIGEIKGVLPAPAVEQWLDSLIMTPSVGGKPAVAVSDAAGPPGKARDR